MTPLPAVPVYDLVELGRRLANVVRRAVVSEVDHAAGRLRARYDETMEGEPATTAWIPWLTRRAAAAADWWAPEVGEQVVLLSQSGELPDAVALPALYSAAHPAPTTDAGKRVTKFGDGASMQYDRAAGAFLFTARDGATFRHDAESNLLEISLPGGGETTLRADGGVSITGDVAVAGNVNVAGDVAATGDVEDRLGTMVGMRTTYNGHTHGSTPPPAPQMT